MPVFALDHALRQSNAPAASHFLNSSPISSYVSSCTRRQGGIGIGIVLAPYENAEFLEDRLPPPLPSSTIFVVDLQDRAA
jgi:hypothetical protein